MLKEGRWKGICTDSAIYNDEGRQTYHTVILDWKGNNSGIFTSRHQLGALEKAARGREEEKYFNCKSGKEWCTDTETEADDFGYVYQQRIGGPGHVSDVFRVEQYPKSELCN